MALIELTPMEEQTLHAMVDPASPEALVYHTDCTIKRIGVDLYGSYWGGVTDCRSSFYRYPTISRFLGRLRKKGLVEQHNGGCWSLSDLGRAAVGLPAW